MMERERRASLERRLALLTQGRRCPGIPHNWRPPRFTEYLRHVPRSMRQEVLERDGRRCLCCGETRHLTVGRIHPRADGGPIATYNLQTLCEECAVLKGSRCLDFRRLAPVAASVSAAPPAPSADPVTEPSAPVPGAVPVPAQTFVAV